MIRVVVQRALGRAIEALPPQALGIRCHAFPVDDRLDECLDGLRDLLGEPGYEGTRCVVGSARTPTTLPPRTVVLPSDLAAAEATRLRNDAGEARTPGFRIVYLNAGSTPGEAGLTDVLVEVRAQALARYFAETAGLPLLAEAGASRARPLVARLEDTTVEALARYDATARDAGEKTALPTLGLLPWSLEADDKERPNAHWVSDFDTMTSGKLIEPLREGIRVLESLEPAARERLTQAVLNTPNLLPAAIRGSAEPIAALTKLAVGVRRFALGQEMDPGNLCGLSRRLLDLLRSPDKLQALSSDSHPEDEEDDGAEDGDDGTDSGEDGEGPPQEAVREEEVVAASGADGLRGRIERFEFEDGEIDVALRVSNSNQLLSLDVGLVHPVTRLTVKDAPQEVAEGVCVDVAPEAAVLAGLKPTRFRVRYRAGPGHADLALNTAINAFRTARAEFISALEGLLPPEEAPKLTQLQRALLALEAVPLTCVANASAAAEAYVGAYVALMQQAFAAGIADTTEKWLTHLDLAVVLDVREDTIAARLQLLHPLRIARSQLWLASRSEPPVFPSSLVALTGYASTALYPQGERYCYHARPRSGPSTAGIEAAVEAGLDALWSLLAPRGLMTALDVELVDVVNAGAAIEALYRTAAERFSQDASVGAGVHLRVRSAYSPARGAVGLAFPRIADLPGLATAVGAAPGSGVTVEILPAAIQAGTDPVHLSIQAVEAPFHGLPPSQHTAGWNARYIPGQSGNVIAVELTGNPALEGYRRLLRHYGRDATATFDPGLAQPGVGKSLVKTFVAYGGWPVRPDPNDSLLSYDVVGGHVIATMLDGAVFDAEVALRLAEFSAGGATAIGDLKGLREGILGLFPCRNFLADLISDADAKHTLGWLGILRAYRDAQRSTRSADTLTLSLDSAEGRAWMRSLAAALGTDESRADLMILEGDVATGALAGVRIVELKARTSAKSLGSKLARARLARQALTTAARVRLALGATDERATELRDGLRKFLWLGAGQQQEALRWRSVFEHFDAVLFDPKPVGLPVTPECWLVPEEEWIGASDETEELDALDACGAPVEGSTTLVRFRVLQAVSRRATDATATSAAPPPATTQPAPSPVRPEPTAAARPPPSSVPAPPAAPPTPIPTSAERPHLRVVTSTENGPAPAMIQGTPVRAIEELPPLPISRAAEPDGSERVEAPRPPAPDGMRVIFGRPAGGGGSDAAVWLPNRTDLVTHFNVGITGTMGSGKTQFTKSLLTQITRAGYDNPGGRRPGLLVFDYKGDYVDLAEGGFAHAVGARVLQPHELPINPLRLKQPDTALDLKLSMRQFAETIRTIARATGDVQRQKIISAIEACLANAGIDVNDRATWSKPFPTMRDLDAYITETDAVEGVPYSVIHDLADLCIFAERDPGVDLDAFFDEVTVIDLRPLAGADKTIAAVISFFMNAFFARMIQQGESRREDRSTASGGKVDLRQVRRLLLVDEADDFISLDLPSLKNVMQQGRAFGYGVILSTQFLHHFDSANSPLKPLVGTWVLHRMADVAPTALRNLFGLSNDEAKALATTLNSLEVHHSVCHGLSNENFRRRLTRIRDLPFFELMTQ